MLLQNHTPTTLIDRQSKTVLATRHLPKRIRKAWDIKAAVVSLALHSKPEASDEGYLDWFAETNAGIELVYRVPAADVQLPSAYRIESSTKPLVAQVWAGENPVFNMIWNYRGVFDLRIFEPGTWTAHLLLAAAHPDVYLK